MDCRHRHTADQGGADERSPFRSVSNRDRDSGGWRRAPLRAGSAQDGADAPPAWTLPRTPDGRPDLQGFWTTQTFTPLERPEHLAGQEFFTEEEVATLRQQLTAEGVDPSASGAINLEDAEAREKSLYQTNREPTYVHYDNEIWLRTPVPKGLSSRRTSLITDPPDGKVRPERRKPNSAWRQPGRQGGKAGLSTGTRLDPC